MIQTRKTPYGIASFACCILAGILFTSCAFATDMRVGIIGTDTSHVLEFTKLLNDASNPDHVPGASVVAAFKGGSPDIPSSRDRVEGFSAELKDKWHVRLVSQIRDLCPLVDGILLESGMAEFTSTSSGKPRSAENLYSSINPSPPRSPAHRKSLKLRKPTKFHGSAPRPCALEQSRQCALQISPEPRFGDRGHLKNISSSIFPGRNSFHRDALHHHGTRRRAGNAHLYPRCRCADRI